MAKKTKAAHVIHVVEIEHATELVTIDEDHAVWGAKGASLKFRKGSFVWVKPPATASDDQIDRVRNAINVYSPSAVRVFPKPRADVVAQATVEKERPSLPARQVVLALAGETTSPWKDAILARCEQTMAEKGL